MTVSEKVCKNIDCGKLFMTKKSQYCCIACRQVGALKQRKVTNIEIFGTENPFQSSIIKGKIKISNISKYGVDNPMKHPELNAKAHATMLSKYGVAHALQSGESLKKMQDTMITRHGGKTSLESKSIRDKILQTTYSKFGNKQFSIAHITDENYKLLNNKEWLQNQNKIKSVTEIMEILGVGQAVVNKKYREFDITPTQFNTSSFELSIQTFLKENGIAYETHNRHILGGKELDIFLPEYNIAIECNGSYWHTELNGKDSSYHLSKSNICSSQNITLYHIWEHEWLYKTDIVRSSLLHKFGKSKKIYGRNCIIKEVSAPEEREFLNKNHLQGYCQSSYCAGLYNNDQLVSLMSFRNSRYGHKCVELLRFSTINNTVVIGAASKLFNKYISEYHPTEIISYSHREKFSGNIYKILGFKFLRFSPPAYYYTNDYVHFDNRMKFQKHKLSKLLENFDPASTEWENMKAHGYDRIWDCGNTVWEYKKG